MSVPDTNLVQPAAHFMQVIPTYLVDWEATLLSGDTVFIRCRVPEPDLDTFTRVIRQNGCTDFHVTLEQFVS